VLEVPPGDTGQRGKRKIFQNSTGTYFLRRWELSVRSGVNVNALRQQMFGAAEHHPVT
jgi:hypothetical protein